MIWCVEDDGAVRELVLYTLRASGYEAEGFENGGEFRSALKEKKPEMVLLDVMLPGEDGLSILRSLRASPATAHIPVIMATARDTEYDKVIGLDLGADDYLAKPFGMMEMLSRIRAVLRRTDAGRPRSLECGRIRLDEGRHAVTVGAKPVLLTLKEYELLKLFMENPGRVLTRDVILSSVWGAPFPGETRTVDVHVGTLRTKLEEEGQLITTVRGVGYKMTEEK